MACMLCLDAAPQPCGYKSSKEGLIHSHLPLPLWCWQGYNSSKETAVHTKEEKGRRKNNHMLALFLAVVTIGCIIAAAMERRETRWYRAGRRKRDATTCGSCGQSMQERGSIRACPRCDRISLDR